MSNAIVQAARKYIGRPFRHRGRGPVYFDCAGLAIQALRDAGREILFDLKVYGREPWRDGLRQAVEANMGPPADGLEVGDVVLIRFNEQPHHIGIIGDYPFGGFSLIHAYGEFGRVTEHRLNDTWRNRIVGAYR